MINILTLSSSLFVIQLEYSMESLTILIDSRFIFIFQSLPKNKTRFRHVKLTLFVLNWQSKKNSFSMLQM